MQRFRRIKSLQKFALGHANLYNLDAFFLQRVLELVSIIASVGEQPLCFG